MAEPLPLPPKLSAPLAALDEGEEEKYREQIGRASCRERV